MRICVDQEGRSAVEQLCDIALKQCGVQNLNAVNKIFASIVLLPIPEKPDVKEPTRPKSLDQEIVKTADKKQEEEVKEEAETETKETETETKEESKELEEKPKVEE